MNRTVFFQLIEMAEVYAKDGAWATAHDRLTKAAEMARQEAASRGQVSASMLKGETT